MATKLPPRRPQHLDALVRQSMAKRGITTHELAERLQGKVNRATLYNWVGGSTTSIGSMKLAAIFAALDLVVVPAAEAE